MDTSVTAEIVSIHESHRTDAQNELINAAAEAAYEIQEATGFAIVVWDANKEYVTFELNGVSPEYVIDTIRHWTNE